MSEIDPDSIEQHGDGWKTLAHDIVDDSDSGEPQDTREQTNSQIMHSTRPRRGRPRGSALVKAVLPQKVANPSSSSVPVPGSIEYARSCRDQKKKDQESKSKNSVSDSLQDALAPFGPVSLLPHVGSPFQKRLRNALCQALKNQIDFEDESICVHFESMHTSATALANFVGCSRSHLQRNLIRTASAVVHGGGWLAGALLCCIDKMICQNVWRPIALIRRLRYDETPTKVRLPQDIPGQECEGPAKGLGKGCSTAVSEHAKILQSEFTVFFLVEDRKTSRHLLLSANLATALQALDRTTAVVMKACLEHTMNKLPELKRLSQKFPLCIHHSCTDKYSANLLAEKGLKSDEPHYIKYHVPCQVHCLATVISAMNTLVQEHTAGILSISLACREVGSAAKLRSILQKFFESELKIRATEPHEEWTSYRNEVYDEFLPVGPAAGTSSDRNLRRRFVLSHFMNANLQDQAIQHMCPFNHCADEAEVHRCFAKLVANALVPTKPPKYSRGRWTNFQEATMWNGLLAAHHGLLERLILEYTGKSKPAPQPNQVVVRDPTDSDEGGWQDVVMQMLGDQPANSELFEAPIEIESEPPQPPHDQPPTGFDWMEYNRRKKAEAAKWASSGPYPNICVMQQVTKHFQKLMHHFLKVSGEEWEKEQEQKVARGEVRSYRVLDFAKGTAVKECFDSLTQCLQQCPRALPLVNHTRKYRVLYFCMICKGMAALHQLIRNPQSGLPYSMFKVLDLDLGWSEFEKILDCQQDELSAKLANHFSQCDRPEAFAILESLAIATCLDVAAIECRHATNRDFSLLRGSGWTPSLQVISAKFACGTFKFNRKRSKKGPKTRQVNQKKKVRKVNRKGKPIHRPGGAWRAFVSEKVQGRKWMAGDMQKYAQEYKTLTDAERMRFQEIGELATLAGQSGYRPFGPQHAVAKQPQQHILPGTVTESGAIVMDNGNWQGEESLALPATERSFETSYSEFAKGLKSLNKKESEPSNAEVGGKSSSQMVDDMVERLGCSAFASTFDLPAEQQLPADGFARPVLPVIHARWKPPVKEMAQVGTAART